MHVEPIYLSMFIRALLSQGMMLVLITYPKGRPYEGVNSSCETRGVVKDNS